MWWQHLERTDLPDLERNGPRYAGQARPSESVPPLVVENDERRPGGHQGVRSVLVTTAVLLLAIAVGLIGVGVTSVRGMFVALVVLGMPFVIATLVAGAVRRRHSPPAP